EILVKIEDRSISVIFIDPNGIEIEFETIRKLSKFNNLDLIINYSVLDLNWNKHVYSKSNNKATKFYGTEDWKDLDSSDRLKLYKSQLRSLNFQGIEDSNEGHLTIHTKSNAPIYHLIYASKHGSLGLKFWRETKNKYQNLRLPL
ncbi:MAG: three-Cys-motif partner protein TcmP, partial [Candidatus Zixiibacteriota bacterium]